jgi:serine protease Do
MSKLWLRLFGFFTLTGLLLSACSAPAGFNLLSAPAQGIPMAQPAAPDAQELLQADPADAVIQQAGGLASIQAFQEALVGIYDQVNPSVVNVYVASQASAASNGLGSGFVWDTQGHIVTNNHVIDGAARVQVTFADGTTVPASMVGKNPTSDLAVLKVDLPVEQLIPLPLMDSDQAKVGQLAIAIGNPYGLAGTMTTGIISGLSRSLPVGLDSTGISTGPRYSIPDIIQTDASINPGNSGGVLVNDQGELIGVTTAIRSTTGANTGIGFVIPANIVKKIVPSLIENGRYDQPWIGISGATLTADMVLAAGLNEGQHGAIVIEIIAGGPAEKAGLRGSSQNNPSGDVIIAINDHAVRRFEDMVSYLYNKVDAGQTVTLTILRGGVERQIELTLGVLPSN